MSEDGSISGKNNNSEFLEDVTVQPPGHGGVPPIVDMSASVEAMMNQALEKAMFKVASQLDDCLDKVLEPKVTAVLKKIATNNSALTSHNVEISTESDPGFRPSHNVPKGTGTPTDGNLSNTADAVQVAGQRGGHNNSDDTISLNGSYMFNEMFTGGPERRSRSGQKSISSARIPPVASERALSRTSSDNHSLHSNKENVDMRVSKVQTNADDREETADNDQMYWEQAASQYEVQNDFGPEVMSHLACAMNRFWTLSLEEDKLKTLKDKAKIPSNCRFMSVKETNKPVFTTASPNARTLDLAIQKMQVTHAAMASHIMHAVTELKSSMNGEQSSHTKAVADRLKDALMLAGDNNQQLNALRRSIFKPTIPTHLKKICDLPPEDAEKLFGDNIQEKLSEIKADNALRDEFKSKPSFSGGSSRGKTPIRHNKGDNRQHPYEYNQEESSNYRASQKSRGGQETGQRQRQQDRSNNYYSDTKNNKNASNNKGGSNQKNDNRNNNNNNSGNKNNPKKYQKKR